MAYLMNPSGTASGVRKPSFADMILLINPHKTPFLSTVKKGKKPSAFIHQWPVRTVPSVITASVADGKDVTSSDATDVESYKKVLSTRPHQLERVAFTGNLTAELEHQYGIKDLHADTVAQQIEALKWDAESVLLGKQDSIVNSVTHVTRGVGAWLGIADTRDASNAITDGATAPYTGYTIDAGCPIDSTVRAATNALVNLGTDAAATATTEANLRSILQGIYEATYAPLDNGMAICTPTMKAHLTTLSMTATVGDTTASHSVPLRRWDNQTANVLGANITRIFGDFGSLDLVPHVGLPSGSTSTYIYPYMYILDRDMWELMMVNPISARQLPDQGGGPRTLLRTAFFNKCAAPIRNGAVYYTKS